MSLEKSIHTDIVVAGAGVAGTFAAVAAARAGAKTRVIERFGMVGGNMGPGYMQGGSLVYFGSIRGGPTDLVREFHGRLAKRRAPMPVPWDNETDIEESVGARMMRLGVTAWDQEPAIASYVASKMMEEAAVDFILSAYVADPILEDGAIKGVFVETVSGRVAVHAKVVIDATGEAAVAARAGCPMLRPGDARPQETLDAIERMKKDYPHFGGAEMAKLMGTPSMGAYVLVAGVDSDAYGAHLQAEGSPCRADGHDLSRRTETIPGVGAVEFQLNRGKASAPGVAGLRLEIKNVPDAGDAEVLSRLEFRARLFCFETVQLMREHTPGCGNAYLVFVSPFLGCRGGTCIDGEYQLTAADMAADRRFDDVIYGSQLVTDDGRPAAHCCDVPYRVLLPRNVDGLLCVGRSASHRRLLRTRPSCMLQGQAAGMAAALSLETAATPKTLDTRELQRRLVEAGFHLGDEARLRELGLGGASPA